MATLLFSQGVPMLVAGDELSHSQKGNNNAYCQDNEITWLNWELDDRKKAFFDFLCRCARIWREQPTLQRRNFFLGRAIRGKDIKDISFFGPDGAEMSDQAWSAGSVRYLGMRLAGDMLRDLDDRGESIKGDTLFLMLNSHWEEIPFTLPVTSGGDVWQTLVDTAEPDRPAVGNVRPATAQFPLYGRSLVLMRTVRPEEANQELSSTQLEGLRKKAQQPSLPPTAPQEAPLAS
jgi:glycogen operon protein